MKLVAITLGCPDFAGLNGEHGLLLGFQRDHQPHGDKARVLTDPVGHPFCILR
ncbi:hypothetical protein ACFUVV_23555 [Streptomyces sp. NPDC057376]|uniref:hypothetical protein n=1 Tax=unclassified Streptomyces TaxID=2593676 RepID=UPI000A8EA085|nr:hypothetical protein [Streptomyces sp. CB02414]